MTDSEEMSTGENTAGKIVNKFENQPSPKLAHHLARRNPKKRHRSFYETPR